MPLYCVMYIYSRGSGTIGPKCIWSLICACLFVYTIPQYKFEFCNPVKVLELPIMSTVNQAHPDWIRAGLAVPVS